MVKVAYAVTHVPGTGFRDRVVAHHRASLPQVEVIRDRERTGVWPTTRRAYERLLVFASPGTTHVAVLVDDFVLCNGFSEHLHAALEAVDGAPLNFFSMRKQVREEHERGKAWYQTSCGIYGGSCVIPIDWVGDYLAWNRARVPSSYTISDRRLAYYLHRVRQVRVWQTVPNLVQHALPAGSLLGHNNPRSVGQTFSPDVGPLSRWEEVPEKPLHITQCSGWIDEFGRMVEEELPL